MLCFVGSRDQPADSDSVDLWFCTNFSHREKNQVSIKTLLSRSGPCAIAQIISDNCFQLLLENYLQTKFGKEWQNFSFEWV